MPFDVLLFMTWKTNLGMPVLDLEWAQRLSGLLPELARREGGSAEEIAVVVNHVHIVVATGTRIDVPRLAQRMKGASTRYLNLDRGTRAPLRWAQGYDVRSISRRNLPAIRDYLNAQMKRHGLEWSVRWSKDARPSGHVWPSPSFRTLGSPDPAHAADPAIPAPSPGAAPSPGPAPSPGSALSPSSALSQ